jgi:hypothetical protein
VATRSLPVAGSGLQARYRGWLAAACLLWLGAGAARAETESITDACFSDVGGCPPASAGGVRPQDEVWVIDSRGVCARSPDEIVRQLRYERYLPDQGWTRAALADFLRQPAEMVTSFFIVGNYYRHDETIEMGWYAYHRLVAQGAEAVKLRFVIWSWPSDPVPGRRLADAKMKLTRVDPAAYCLASLIDLMDTATPISLCGSSYGAGIAAGSLELLAGGRLDCYQLPPRVRPARRICLVLIGAAMHNDALLPGRRYDRVIAQTQRTLIFINPADRALRRYHRLYGRRSGFEALGRTGPAGMSRMPEASHIDLARADAYVGRRHGMLPYWQASTLVAWMRPYLLMQPPGRPRLTTREPRPPVASG